MFALLLALGAVFVPPLDVAAQGDLTLDARAGFEGYYKVGTWVPVQVTVANEGPDIEGEIQVIAADSQPSQVLYTQRATLPTRSHKQYTLHVLVGNYARELDARLVQEGKVLAKVKASLQPLPAETYLIGVVSDDPAALSYLAGLPAIGNRRFHVAHLAPEDLPIQGGALQGMDVLVLHAADTSSLSDGQRVALRGWIALGGHLIVVGGPDAERTAAGLGDLLPVTLVGSETTTDVGALGDLADAPFIPGVPAVVAVVQLAAGPGSGGTIVLAGTPDRPLIVRRRLDQGTIDYLALDPDLEPMRTWIGNDALWSKLLSPPSLSAYYGVGPTSALRRPGGGIGMALANIPSLDVPSVFLVLAYLFVFILVVGPLNFAVLKLVDRRAWAWITVPVIVLFFGSVAYLAGLSLRGRKVVVSQATILRAQPESGMAAIDSYAGLYSPVRDTYDAQLPDGVLVHRTADYSYALGSGIREALKVEVGPPTYVRQLEVDVGAMGDFAVHTVQQWPGVEADLTLSRTAGGMLGSPAVYRVEGTLTNHSDTTVRDLALIMNATSVLVPDLAPGETQPVAVEFRRKGIPYYVNVADALVDTYPNMGQRERDRRRTILHSVFEPRTFGSAPMFSAQGLTLIGWLDEGPVTIDVKDVSSSTVETTLLLASLPTSSADDAAALVPRGSMSWELVEGEPGMSPYALYQHQSRPTFRFHLPNPGVALSPVGYVDVDTLILHVDSPNPSFGTPPVTLLRDIDSGEWVPLTGLTWGENEIPDPQRFIGDLGAGGGTESIEIQIATDTIQNNPVSVDFTVLGARE
jgi:hypothetical protein